MESIPKFYNEMSILGKLLVFVAFILVVTWLFRKASQKKWLQEGFHNPYASADEPFVLKQDGDIYDTFYANIYDHLVHNSIKNNYEISAILNKTAVDEKRSRFVDLGCGTGHHVKMLCDRKLNATGIDLSPAMIDKAKELHPEHAVHFRVGNATDRFLLEPHSVTHIMCMYFSLYYIKDKYAFFENCMYWLQPGGYLIVHLVDPDTFDPILPPGNPLYVVSPQKYAKERITKTKITFNDFVYHSNFQKDENNATTFNEKLKFNNGMVRKHVHHLYMDSIEHITREALDAGFSVKEKVNLVHCAYENQHLYIFVKG